MKKAGKRLLSVGLSLVLSATLFISLGVQALAYTETTGTVSSDNVKVRSSASTTASQVSSLKNGDKVDIVDEATDASGYVWYKIRVNKSEYGFVRSDLVSKAGGASTASTTTNTTQNNGAAAAPAATTVTTTDSKTATITEASVNVRQGAGTGFDSVGKVTKGETVTITGEATGTDNKTWYQVTFGSNNKQGFIRSDLLKVSDAAPAETTENPEGGETVEGGEAAEGAEAAEDGENQEQSQAGAAVTSEAGDGTYSLVYITDEAGSGIWYLYDNVEGYRVKVNELIEAARSSDEVNKLVKTNSNYKTVLIILAVVIAALIIGLILLALKLRDSLYYEDEEEEEFDRYSQPSRRRGRDEAEDEEEDERPRRGRAAEERTVRPSRDRDDSERTVRPSRRDQEADERPSRRGQDADDRPSRRGQESDERASRRGRASVDYEEERAARRGSDDRPSRPSRRDDEFSARQARKSSVRNEEPVAVNESPKRKTRNFVGDEDDFEFEFLDLDDDK